MADNKKCALCHGRYSYCPTCNTNEPVYKNMFCSENCKDVFITVCKIRDNVLNDDEAKEILASLDLSKIDSYSDAARTRIKKTLNIKEEAKEIETKEVEEVEEVKEIVETNEAIEKNDIVTETVVDNIEKEESIETEEVSTMKYIPKQRRKK